jgi:hypothetical protein
MKRLASMLTVLAVAGCAAPMAWNKPGATQADFNTDKYQCMRSSQQQSSSAYVNAYYGSASSGQTTNIPLFDACMNARGWSLERQVAGSREVANTLKAEFAKICGNPQFAPYYRKTPCRATEITFQQLSDPSKMSPAEKEIFPEVRGALEAYASEVMDAQRKYGGAAGARRADQFATTFKSRYDKNNLDLYSGLITWGEFNRRRQEIYNDEMNAAR